MMRCINGLIRVRIHLSPAATDPCQTRDISRIHKRARIVKARGPGNPCQGESPHPCRTEKRTSAHA